ILITDGWSQSGAYDQFLADLKKAGITLSTIGTGGGSAHILQTLAQESGGRYYDAADATKIPDIFLKETIQTAGERIVEERFQPCRDGELGVEVTSLDDDGTPRNFFQTVVRLVAPDLTPLQTMLQQIGPGHYAGSLRADQQGAYLVRVAQTRPGASSASRTL